MLVHANVNEFGVGIDCIFTLTFTGHVEGTKFMFFLIDVTFCLDHINLLQQLVNFFAINLLENCFQFLLVVSFCFISLLRRIQPLRVEYKNLPSSEVKKLLIKLQKFLYFLITSLCINNFSLRFIFFIKVLKHLNLIHITFDKHTSE